MEITRHLRPIAQGMGNGRRPPLLVGIATVAIAWAPRQRRGCGGIGAISSSALAEPLPTPTPCRAHARQGDAPNLDYGLAAHATPHCGWLAGVNAEPVEKSVGSLAISSTHHALRS